MTGLILPSSSFQPRTATLLWPSLRAPHPLPRLRRLRRRLSLGGRPTRTRVATTTRGSPPRRRPRRQHLSTHRLRLLRRPAAALQARVTTRESDVGARLPFLSRRVWEAAGGRRPGRACPWGSPSSVAARPLAKTGGAAPRTTLRIFRAYRKRPGNDGREIRPRSRGGDRQQTTVLTAIQRHRQLPLSPSSMDGPLQTRRARPHMRGLLIIVLGRRCRRFPWKVDAPVPLLVLGTLRPLSNSLTASPTPGYRWNSGSTSLARRLCRSARSRGHG